MKMARSCTLQGKAPWLTRPTVCLADFRVRQGGQGCFGVQQPDEGRAAHSGGLECYQDTELDRFGSLLCYWKVTGTDAWMMFWLCMACMLCMQLLSCQVGMVAVPVVQLQLAKIQMITLYTLASVGRPLLLGYLYTGHFSSRITDTVAGCQSQDRSLLSINCY